MMPFLIERRHPMTKYALWTRNKVGEIIFIRRSLNSQKLSSFGVDANEIADAALFDTRRDADAALFDTRRDAEDAARDADREYLEVAEVKFNAEITI
jgi:hypothetical protein